ncbi:MAG: rubrerythrin family protein [Chitinivibrionales bacterium]|nr:rubrerythrin family protein [Chitinivibrionales bacterium]
MPELNGSRTEKNLVASFAGESQARNRYTWAAKIAEKEGYPQIADIFLQTADHERIHANSMCKKFAGGPVAITATYPADPIGTTLENLQAAAAEEHEEVTALYPSFAETAGKEGFPQIAAMYRTIAKAESWHEERFNRLIANIKNGAVFKRDKPVKWVCRKCGFIHEGAEPLNMCPACLHDKKHFEILAENF